MAARFALRIAASTTPALRAARPVGARGFAVEKLKDVIFTSSATNTGGGRGGAVVKSHGEHAYPIELPMEKHPNHGGGAGGPGKGSNPEELFACGYASCFNGAMVFVAGQNNIPLTSCETTAHVSFGPTDSGVGIAVKLETTAHGVDQATADKLGELTHAFCPYSKATRGNIEVDVKVTAN